MSGGPKWGGKGEEKKKKDAVRAAKTLSTAHAASFPRCTRSISTAAGGEKEKKREGGRTVKFQGAVYLLFYSCRFLGGGGKKKDA